jgi:hypothetical protein
MKLSMISLLALVLITFTPTMQSSFAYSIKCTTDFTATPTKQTVYTNETSSANISYSGSVGSCTESAKPKLMSLSVLIASPSGSITTLTTLPSGSGVITLNDAQLLQHGTWRLKLTWEYEVESTNGLVQFYFGHAKCAVVSEAGT